MDNLDFYKKFFVRNDDTAFKIAIMFSQYSKIDTSRQSLLFYANKDIVKKGVNFLTFTDMFNETLAYTNNWLLDLESVKDEFDWEFHRSKLLTRFSTQRLIDFQSVYEKLWDADKSTANLIRNISILWNNSIHLVNENSYRNTASPKLWELWDILVKYNKGDYDNIKGDEWHQKEFKNVIKYRNQNAFYKDRQATLEQDADLVEKVQKGLDSIMFKDILAKELPIISTIRKRLKI
jgi:hypothetical protein